MDQKKINILNELSQALSQADFNLEAWKMKAKLVMKSLFGSGDERIDLIEKLHYDYSSWSLRDNSGGKMIDPVKKTAAEIVGSALIELEINQGKSSIEELFSRELTGSQFKELKEAVGKNNEEEIDRFTSRLEADLLKRIVRNIIQLSFNDTPAN